VATSAKLDIYGVKQALKELNDIDPTYRRQITKDVKKAGEPVLTAARSFIPTAPPLTGMRRGSLIKGRDGTKWSNTAVSEGFKILTNRTGKPAKTVQFSSGDVVNFDAIPYQLLTLQQKDAAGAIWDHAGKRTPDSLFVANLMAYGKGIRTQPRAADPGVEASRPAVEGVITDIVGRVMDKVNRKLQVNYGY
jgi:hypothetical protein